MKHRVLHAVLLSALILAMAPTLSVPAQVSQTVRIGLLTPIDSLDPLSAKTSSEFLLAEQLFLGLTTIDDNGKLQAGLASTWEVSEDALTWTFFLKQGVKWVDFNRNLQRDVTAGDVALAIQRALDSGTFQDIISSVNAVDDYTIVFELTQPFAQFDSLMAISTAAKPLPSDILKQYGDQWAQPKLMWTNGAYLPTDWTGTMVQLEANPYWADPQIFPVRTARVEYIPDPNDALRRYQGGDLDLIELSPETRQLAAQDATLAGEIHDIQNNSPGAVSVTTLVQIQRFYSYLVKPYVLPTFSQFFGLGRFHQWQLPKDDPSVSIPETTRVLDDETLNALQSMKDDQSELVFERMTPQLSVIQINDILVGRSTIDRPHNAAPFGFLRRVVSTFIDGSGQFIIDTVQAALDEAIERGSQSFSIPLEFSDVYLEEVLTTSALPQRSQVVPVGYVAPQSDFRVTIDHVVYDEDGDLTTKNDQVKAVGWVKLEPGMSFNFSVNISQYQLVGLSFSNTMHEGAHVELSSKVKVLGFDKNIPIKRFMFFPQTIWIGAVPLVITPQLTIYVGASGAVSVSVSMGIEQSSTITTGVKYADGSWSPIGEITDNSIGPLETQVNESAKAGAFAGPEFSLKLYGVAGPYGRMNSYLDLNADPAGSPWWTLKGGVKAELGIKAEVFSHVVASYSENFPIIEQTLAQSSGEISPPQPTTVSPTTEPSPDHGNGKACQSIWWPLTCWPWWLWAIVVILAIVIIFNIL